MSKLLRLGDNVLVEIDGPSDAPVEMHASSAEQVATTMESASRALNKILKPIGEAFHGLKTTLDVPIEVKEAAVELGLCFSAEGHIFVAKAKAEGNLKVTVTFQRPGNPGGVAPAKTGDK